jgi:catechol 2,3-dioxygenase-like lactoylglutathione lyase family enzyme
MTKLSTIGQIAMVVKDVPRAVTFYRDTLGMRFLFQAPPALAFFDCDGIRLMLTVPEEKEFDHPGSPIYFKGGRHRGRLRGSQIEGGRVPRRAAHDREDAPPELWMAFFNDGEGNTLALMHERR